jgi:hypothetical protein
MEWKLPGEILPKLVSNAMNIKGRLFKLVEYSPNKEAKNCN